MDPIAVGITRIRIARVFREILQMESNDPLALYVDAAIIASIASGNALGIEIGEDYVITISNHVIKTPLQEQYEGLYKTTTHIYQQDIPRRPNNALIKGFEKLEQVRQAFFKSLFNYFTDQVSKLQMNFTWDTYFPHVLGKGGFDIIIGNPPYIRQEDISARPGEFSTAWRDRKGKQRESRNFNRNFKKKLAGASGNLTGVEGGILSSKADLSAYFFLLTKYLSTQGGICGFITPNAWLDVEYGFALQEFLIQQGTLLGMYEKKYARSFTAAINTVLTVWMPKQPRPSIYPGGEVEFISIENAYKDLLSILPSKVSANHVDIFTFQNIAIKSNSSPAGGFAAQSISRS